MDALHAYSSPKNLRIDFQAKIFHISIFLIKILPLSKPFTKFKDSIGQLIKNYEKFIKHKYIRVIPNLVFQFHGTWKKLIRDFQNIFF